MGMPARGIMSHFGGKTLEVRGGKGLESVGGSRVPRWGAAVLRPYGECGGGQKWLCHWKKRVWVVVLWYYPLALQEGR